VKEAASKMVFGGESALDCCAAESWCTHVIKLVVGVLVCGGGVCAWCVLRVAEKVWLHSVGLLVCVV